MGLILENEHQIILQNDEYIAVRQSGHIEIWDNEGTERYGMVPENYTLTDIERIMSFYHQGFSRGTRYGQISKMNEIRTALSL